MLRTLPLATLLLTVACTGGSADETGLDCDEADTADDCGGAAGDGSGDGDDGGDNYIPLSEAPPATLNAGVYAAGQKLSTVQMSADDSTLQGNLSSGVLLMAGTQDGTLIQITLWEPIEVGGSWPIEPTQEGIPSNATLVYVDGSTGGSEGGMAYDGTLTITGWYDTDSPQLKLAEGTFEADPVLNEDQPGWERTLRDGAFTHFRVTSL